VLFNLVTDGEGDNDDPAYKTWVDAYITISPATDTNNIGDEHPLTACVVVDDGEGPAPAENGTVIEFEIDSGPGILSAENCTVTDGTGCCSVILTSDTVGTTVIIARSTVNVGSDGAVFNLETDGEGDNSPPAEKDWIGGEGCTPGFWKNHPDCWGPTGFSPGDNVSDVFPCFENGLGGLGGDSLMEALNYEGGKGLPGAARILLRAAVAAVLNAAHPDIDYPQPGNGLAWEEIVADVCAAVAIDRDAMLDLADDLDDWNNYGCPIDAHCDPIENGEAVIVS
jgi:hypothetical protein